jgi:hypothetical protein
VVVGTLRMGEGRGRRDATLIDDGTRMRKLAMTPVRERPRPEEPVTKSWGPPRRRPRSSARRMRRGAE